ncbi:hypothetical protein V5N11_011988 [Cardamine amara subsp. amara]|uniref:CCHC-type domain-containing protein n=1 Tax=Cardamine amara subsp. amara TaxID=228776 RepID=A0ABD0ZS08_CARAN
MAAVNIQDLVSDDFDYGRWSSNVQKSLVESGVWDVVANGVSPDPTKNPELAATIKVVDLAQWRNCVIKNLKALKIIQSSLPHSFFRKTISVASAKDLWDLLKKGNDNEEVRQAKLRKLEKQFEELMMHYGEPMDFYLGRFLDITDQLRNSGNPKPDDEVIEKLLTSLSWEYDEAIPVVKEFMNLPDMTLHDLLNCYDMFGSHVDAMPHMLMDFIKSLRKAKAEQTWCGVCKKYNHYQEDCYYNPMVITSSGIKGQCFQCGERGHYARDCDTRKMQLVAKAADKEQQKIGVKADFTYDEDMWMVYKTTSEHMTPYEKFFSTLDRTVRAQVELANGNVIMAEGRGNARIMINGVKMVIKDVLFVPGINRNVLSFSQMAKSGYSMEMGGGEITIRDGTGKIFAQTMREKRGIALRLQVVKS